MGAIEKALKIALKKSPTFIELKERIFLQGICYGKEEYIVVSCGQIGPIMRKIFLGKCLFKMDIICMMMLCCIIVER